MEAASSAASARPSRATASISSATKASLIRPSPRSRFTTRWTRLSASSLLIAVPFAAAPSDRQRLDAALKLARLLLGQPRAHEQRTQVALHQRRLVGRMKEATVLKLLLKVRKQRIEFVLRRRRALGVAKPSRRIAALA